MPEENKCPDGFIFGYEHDEHTVCTECPLFNECENEENTLLKLRSDANYIKDM